MIALTRGKWLALLCLLPFALFFIVFEIAPLVWVLISSLQTEESGWSLENFTRIFTSKFYRQAIQFSLEISFYSSIFGIIIATLGSYSLRRVDSPLRNFVTAFANMTSNFAGVPWPSRSSSCWGSTAVSPSCSSRPESLRTSTCTRKPA